MQSNIAERVSLTAPPGALLLGRSLFTGFSKAQFPKATARRAHRNSRFDVCVVALIGATIAIALFALAGWSLPVALQFHYLFPAMNPVVAVGFLAAVASLLVFRWGDSAQSENWVGYTSAAAVLALGALKLSSIWFVWNLNIDGWLFANEVAARSNPEIHFPPKTAFAFVLVGGALLLLRNARSYRFAEILSFSVVAIGVLNVQGTAFGLGGLHTAPGFVPMSHFTGVAFTLLGIAMVLAGPERGAMKIIASDTAGGLLARRLLPLAVILPLGLGGLRRAGESAGWYNADFGAALFATAFMMVFLAVIWWVARLLFRLDLKRREAEFATQLSEERVQRLNLELEQRIADRTLALESANAANQELEAFSYSVSHDLRAPLRAINGFSKIVIEEHSAALDADGQRYLRQVRSSAVQMGQLVDDLLTFSRTGRQALAVQPVAVTEMVQACLAELRQMQENRHVEIRVGDLPDCEADPSLLKQLWLNLLSNALKYSSKRDQAVITIGSRREAGVDTYFVQDNGVGFDMKYAPKLFNVFQRLHLAEDFDGTGVGLALAHRIVKRHGGRMWAEAEVDKGATFSFCLGGGSDV